MKWYTKKTTIIKSIRQYYQEAILALALLKFPHGTLNYLAMSVHLRSLISAIMSLLNHFCVKSAMMILLNFAHPYLEIKNE